MKDFDPREMVWVKRARGLVCVVVTERYLTFAKVSNFKPGDRCFLNPVQWREALHAGCAPAVLLGRSDLDVLGQLPELIDYAQDLN